MRALAGLAAATLTCAGCALPPEFISGSTAGEPNYSGLSCPELAVARGNVQKELGLASREQARFVGVVFPSAQYQRNTTRIAQLKGTLAAIQRAQRLAACPGSGAGNAGTPAALPSMEAGPDDGAAAEADDIGAGEPAW